MTIDEARSAIDGIAARVANGADVLQKDEDKVTADVIAAANAYLHSIATSLDRIADAQESIANVEVNRG